MSEQELADALIFPELDDDQMAIVFALGERRQVSEGEILFSPSDDHYDWIVILSGLVEVLGANDAADRQPRSAKIPRRGQPGHPPAPLPVDPGRPGGRGRGRAG